jgi:addiction module RelB/DinJ family antitoxin
MVPWPEFVTVAHCSYTGGMKTEVVRARIESALKAQATAVLADSGLEMSDAIRLFLRQVVRAGGLPFPVKGGGVRVVSGKRLWQMKRASQARDRDLLARGTLAIEDVMLIKPKALRGARIRWPTAKLSD